MATDPNLNPTDQDIDPLTGKPKKTGQAASYNPLPMLTPSAPTVALSKDALAGNAAVAPTAAGTTQGNTDILAKAQTDVLNQPSQNTGLSNAVTQQAQNFATNPMGDFNGAKVKQAGLEKADTDWAKQFEAQRQQYGNVGGSGLLQKNMLENALEHGVNQAALGANYDSQNLDNYLKSMQSAISTGQSVNQGNENVFSQRLGNLNTVRGMAEGERSQTAGFAYDASKTGIENAQQLLMQLNDLQGQKDLANLQGKIQSGQLLQQQDFAASQSSLDRALKVAQQNNDIQAQKDITQMKGEIDKQAQAAQNDFANAQRMATQIWQSGENSKQQDIQKALQANQIQADAAKQANDIDAQKYLQSQQASLQLKLQTNEMGQQEKMAYLNAQLAEAKANGDVGRQKEIIGFQTAQDMAKIEKEQGFQAAQSAIQDKLKLAMQQNDFTQASALQEKQLQMTKYQTDINTELEKARQALTGKQIDMQGQQMTFDQIEKGIEAGQIDPASGAAAIKKAAASAGITIKDVDPDASNKAALKEVDTLKKTWGATHPTMVDPKTGNLTTDGEKAFNADYNKTMFGDNGIGGKYYTDANGNQQETTQVDSTVSPNNVIGMSVASYQNANGGYTPLAEGQQVMFKSSMGGLGYTLPAGTYKMVTRDDAIKAGVKDITKDSPMKLFYYNTSTGGYYPADAGNTDADHDSVRDVYGKMPTGGYK